MPQRKGAFAGIVQSKTIKSVVPVNKAKDPGYTKLTSYVPLPLYSAFKAQMMMDGTHDLSSYVERVMYERVKARNPNFLRNFGYERRES